MFNKIKNAVKNFVKKVKAHVFKHRAKYIAVAVVAVAVVAAILIGQHSDFLSNIVSESDPLMNEMTGEPLKIITTWVSDMSTEGHFADGYKFVRKCTDLGHDCLNPVDVDFFAIVCDS